MILPKGILLSSIEWTTERARIIWVDSHRYEVRTPNQDIEEKNMIWKAYEVKNARRLTTFDWDLDSGEAMLMIQSMPKGADYFQVKKQIENQLEEIIPISQFEQTQVSKAIRKIEESTECEGVGYLTIRLRAEELSLGAVIGKAILILILHYIVPILHSKMKELDFLVIFIGIRWMAFWIMNST